MRADAVVLDVGETILDRSREYAAWARHFGVPAHTFSAVFGAMIARGAGVAQVVESFGDGRPFAELLADRGDPVELAEQDLYPDVRPAIAQLRAAGVIVGVAGNQPARIGAELRALELGAEFVASSDEWGVAKPAPAFFARVARAAGCPPQRVLYVGDQLRNDVQAPTDCGLTAVRVRRGPWGHLERDPVVEARALAVVDSLLELPDVVTGRWRPAHGRTIRGRRTPRPG